MSRGKKMRLAIHFAAAAALASVATPALADEFFAVTPSGATETVFGEEPQAVVGKLSSKCMDMSWSVVRSSSAEVVCEAPLNMGQSIVGQMLLGNSYSTPPRRYFRFNFAEVNGISRVQASGWMEVQMAFGQVNRSDLSGPEFHNGMMNFMSAAGGKAPVGTTFPNHVVVGFESETITEGKSRLPRITKITPGSAAEKSGLQVGDIVTRIAGERMKNYDEDWLDGAARAAKKPTYEVEFIRDGTKMNATLERAFRPAWTEQVAAAADASEQTSAPAVFSVADELAKLAKLKDDGTLTEAEFEVEKKKLLGQ